MRFEYPIVLLLLWLLPILCIGLWVFRRNKLNRAKKIVSASISNLSNSLFYIQLVLITLAFALGVVALARPQWGERTETVYVNGRNVAILVDVSRSMLAEDVHPNRLERAKADLVDLVEELSGERISIIAFRSSSRILCPFTTDKAFLLETISSMGIDSAPRGETDIGGALEIALNAFPEENASHNAIILISDGEDLSGEAKSSAEKAAERGIPIFCVGIGDVEGATIPQTRNGAATYGSVKYDGETVVTKLDNKTLQIIANITNGAYIPLATASTGKTTLGDVFDRYIAQLEAQDLEEQRQEYYIERYQIFLLPAIICLIIVGALSRGRPGVGRYIKKASILALLSFYSSISFASVSTNVVESNSVSLPPTNAVTNASVKVGESYNLSRQAQRCFEEGRFEEAAKLYEEAALDPEVEPELLQEIYYNLGVAWLACESFEEAIKAFDLVTDAELLSSAKEAIGFAKYKLCIPEIDAYNENPDNMDENGVPKNFEATIKAKEGHIAKLTEALKYYREASELLLSNGENVSHLKASIATINNRLNELAAEKEFLELIVKHGGKPFEVNINEITEGVRQVYEVISQSVNSGVPSQEANNSAAKSLEELFKQWQLTILNIIPLHFGATEAQSKVLLETKMSVYPKHFDLISENMGKYKAVHSNPKEMLKELSNTEEALVEIQYYLYSPPALLEKAIDFQTNAISQAVNSNSLRTAFTYQIAAIEFGHAFLDQFPWWIKELQKSDTKTFNEEFGGKCFDEQMLEHCKTLTPEVLEEIDILSIELRDLLSGEELAGVLFKSNAVISGKEREKSIAALDVMQKIYALLFPQQQDQQQDQEQDQQQDQQQQEQEQDQQQDQQQQEQEQDQQQNQQQDQQQEQDQQQKPQEPEQETSSSKEMLDEREADELLQRLLMQERELKERKRRREDFYPIDSNVRDW